MEIYMKKKLLALAAFSALAGVAQAQSVTLYGIVDVNVTYGTNAGGTTGSLIGMGNGGLSTSRWGLKGTEDLGGGSSAFFNLESEILADTGAQGVTATDLFHRAAFVGLSNSELGSFRAGRQNSAWYDMAAKYDAFGGNNFGGWVATSTGSVDLGLATRFNNAIQYTTPSFNGLSLYYQHAFGEVAGNNTNGLKQLIGGEYVAGKFAGTAMYFEDNTSATLKTKYVGAYVSYDFGVAKVNAGYANKKADNSTAIDGMFIGAKAPVNAKTNLIGQVASYSSGSPNNKKPMTFALGATYDLSKRTTAYAIGAFSSQDNNSVQNLVSTTKFSTWSGPATGLNQQILTIGVRHMF